MFGNLGANSTPDDIVSLAEPYRTIRICINTHNGEKIVQFKLFLLEKIGKDDDEEEEEEEEYIFKRALQTFLVYHVLENQRFFSLDI